MPHSDREPSWGGGREASRDDSTQPVNVRAALLARDNAGLRAEVRYRYEPKEALPDGLEWLRNEFGHDPLLPGRPYWALYRETAHPDQLVWIELRQITQRRYVTEWADA